VDFRFGSEEEAFRDEIRAFVRAELPAGWGEPAYNDREDSPADLSAPARAFQRKLADKGWLTLAWPKEYGGLGAGPMQQLVYNEEMSALRAPAFPGIGVAMVGPTLMLHGTDEQRARFLTAIARNEMSWCQGFSEPGAGSDLASLQTRAVQDGDDFIINGQKIWTSNAHRADYCILLARTDPDAPKHRGISYFLMDMKSPGITISRLTNMLGSDHFNPCASRAPTSSARSTAAGTSPPPPSTSSAPASSASSSPKRCSTTSSATPAIAATARRA
jgi:alkylation response protein AidB-like acyl-CoA dehydrogenase